MSAGNPWNAKVDKRSVAGCCDVGRGGGGYCLGLERPDEVVQSGDIC